MGFSVSASVAILLAATLIAFGMFHSAAYNTVERVTDAQAEAKDDLLDQQNTAIDLTEAVYYQGNDSLHVNVTNTGATTLSVSETDLLADNEYRSSFADREVEGDGTTDVWAPGETLQYNVTSDSQPDRVTVVSGPGVAASGVVERG